MALPRQLREIKNCVRNVFAHETLEEAPPEPAATRRQFAASLFGRETLPLDPEPAPAPRSPGVLAMLLAPEVLPEDPEESPRPPRRGLLSALFAPEPLPALPVAPPRRRAAWLRWLFHFEHLDPP